MKRERKIQLQYLGEDAVCKMLGWRTDIMSKHCAKQPLVTTGGGHSVKPETKIGYRPRRSRKNYD